MGVMLWELCSGKRLLSGDPQRHLEDVAAGRFDIPRLASVRVSRLAVMRLTSTAPATLRIRIVRGARTVKRTTAHVTAGASRVPLPVRSLALGRYHVEVAALDAAGRRIGAFTRALVVSRAARARRPRSPVLATPLLAPAPPPPVVFDDHGSGRHSN